MYQSLQGNLGLGKAINYFTSKNITVSIPLNDTQKYDLVADFNGKLQKISVKTSRQTRNQKSYAVQLRNTGGGRANEVRQVNFDNKSCDYLFIYLADERMFLIPSKMITATNSIVVGVKYSKYEVFNDTFEDFIKENL